MNTNLSLKLRLRQDKFVVCNNNNNNVSECKVENRHVFYNGRDRTSSVTPLVGLLLGKPVGDMARDAASFEA